MSQGNGTRDSLDFYTVVLWGRSPAVITRAIKLAGAIFVIVAVFTYVGRAAHEEVVYLNIASGSLDFIPWRGIFQAFDHPVLIVGLATIYAYLNEGYLPGVLLAAAPVSGTTIWIYSGPSPGPYLLIPKPFMGNWEWVLSVSRTVVPLATVGFLLGFVVRWIRTEVLPSAEPT